jgi:hypothetical protein
MNRLQEDLNNDDAVVDLRGSWGLYPPIDLSSLQLKGRFERKKRGEKMMKRVKM